MGILNPIRELLAFLRERGPEVKRLQLHNGARALLIQTGEAPVFYYRAIFRVGALDDPPGKSGLAHLLEHMAFMGTPEVGSRDPARERKALRRLRNGRRTRRWLQEASALVDVGAYERLVDRAGGIRLNAMTTLDTTQYYYALPSSQLEFWAELESGRFLEPVFRQFPVERDVVLQERLGWTESSPYQRFWEGFQGWLFRGTPYARPIIGYAEDLRALRLEDVENFFREYYGARNLVLVLAGRYPVSQAERVIRRYFGSLRPGKATQDGAVPLRFPSGERYQREEKILPILCLAFPIPPYAECPRPALEAILGLLVFSRDARLVRRLVHRERLASHVYGEFWPGDRLPRALLLSFSLNAGSRPERALQVAEEELERFLEEGPTKEEVARIQQIVASDVASNLQDPAHLATTLGTFESIAGDWKLFFRDLEEHGRLDAPNIRKVARQFLELSRMAIGIAG